jgi:GTPase SAR1 family protein
MWDSSDSPIVSELIIDIEDPTMQKNYDYILKFVIVGSSSVGKSSILRRFADDEFEESYISTIGIDFRFK